MKAPTDHQRVLRQQADALRALLLIMWIRKSDVVLWADEWILRLDAPPDWLLRVALTKDTDDPIRVCEDLSHAEGRANPDRTAAEILPLFARELREHPAEWGDLVAGLHRLLSDHLSPLARPGEVHTGELVGLQLTVWQFADERALGHGWYRKEGAHAAITSDLAKFNDTPAPPFLTTLPTLRRFAS